MVIRLEMVLQLPFTADDSTTKFSRGLIMEDEHKISEVICLKCFYRWIAVRPVGTSLKDMECPCCKKVWYAIETGEEMDE